MTQTACEVRQQLALDGAPLAELDVANSQPLLLAAALAEIAPGDADAFRVHLTTRGLVPCPKLFQNLRSTHETELAEGFPLHVVCAWIGNS